MPNFNKKLLWVFSDVIVVIRYSFISDRNLKRYWRRLNKNFCFRYVNFLLFKLINTQFHMFIIESSLYFQNFLVIIIFLTKNSLHDVYKYKFKNDF